MLLPSFAPLVVAGLVGLLWLMLMAQAYQQGRSRRQLQRDLARIFEQLDLLALAPLATAAAAPVLRAAGASMQVRSFNDADDGDTVSELIARGADERELATRCGIAPAEARILIAMRGTQRASGTLQ
jgi:hypothetical protein